MAGQGPHRNKYAVTLGAWKRGDIRGRGRGGRGRGGRDHRVVDRENGSRGGERKLIGVELGRIF